MFLLLGVLLALAWLFGFVVFKVSAAAIHLLVVLAIIAVVAHFARRGASTVV